MVPITEMVAVSAMAAAFVVKLMLLPLPVAGRPMLGLLFNQLKVAPVVPLRAMLTFSPAQALTLPTGFTVGVGETVRLKFCEGPVQLPITGVTVMVPVCTAATVGAVPAMLPVPVAASPMAVLELVQVRTVLAGVALKFTLMGSPMQRFRSVGSTKEGIGLTLMVNVLGVPLQALAKGVTVMVATVVFTTLVVVKAMLPLPEAGRPMLVLLLVQLKVAPGDPPMLTPAG